VNPNIVQRQLHYFDELSFECEEFSFLEEPCNSQKDLVPLQWLNKKRKIFRLIDVIDDCD